MFVVFQTREYGDPKPASIQLYTSLEDVHLCYVETFNCDSNVGKFDKESFRNWLVRDFKSAAFVPATFEVEPDTSVDIFRMNKRIKGKELFEMFERGNLL